MLHHGMAYHTERGTTVEPFAYHTGKGTSVLEPCPTGSCTTNNELTPTNKPQCRVRLLFRDAHSNAKAVRQRPHARAGLVVSELHGRLAAETIHVMFHMLHANLEVSKDSPLTITT
jgi:hypothetical protein